VGLKESVSKRIDYIEGKLRFFRNALLGLVSAIIGTIYAIMEHKAGKEVFILSGIGIVVLIFVFIRIKSLENKQEQLLNKLEKEE